MALLKFRKVNTLPPLLEHNTIYFVFNNGQFGLYLTNNVGTAAYGLSNTDVAISGPTSLVASHTATYEITDYNSFINYTISAIAGTVSIAGNLITYTAPAATGSKGFIINGKTFAINVVNTYVSKPSVTSPVHNSIDIVGNPTITSSAFTPVGGTDTHSSSDWQLASDAAFNDIIQYASASVTNKTSWIISGLLPNTVYYVRVRYNGTAFTTSEWSAGNKFTTKTAFVPDLEESALSASDKSSSDQFGYSVSISDNGDRIIVGVPASDPSGLSSAGAAYIFSRTGTTWTQEAKLTASDKASNDNFGWSVAMDATGIRIIVGAYLEDPGGTSNAGSAYIYVRSDTTWSEEAKIFASDKATNNQFGFSLAIDGTGTRVIVGASRNNPGSATNGGAAYIFSRAGTTWTQEAKIFASDKANNAYFASSVAIGAAGNRVAVGAIGATVNTFTNAGAVYTYLRDDTTWTQEAKLIAPNVKATARMGQSVALTANSNRVVIGAHTMTIGSVSSCGAAYVFSRAGNIWTYEAELVASDNYYNDNFGYSVSIDNLGETIAIGVPFSNLGGIISCGAIYVFARTGNIWSEEGKLFSSSSDTSDNLGNAIELAGDGSRIAAGGYLADPSGTTDAGAVYIFS